MLTLHRLDFIRRIDTIEKIFTNTKRRALRFQGLILRYVPSFGVGLEAKLAQHITLLVVIARRLIRFCLNIIQTYHILILRICLSRNVTLSPLPRAFFVYFLFVQSDRGCLESPNHEVAV